MDFPRIFSSLCMLQFLSFILWDASPEIFRVAGVVSVRWYGLMWALGFIVSRQVGLYIFLKDDRYTEGLHTLFLYIIIPALIGARLAHFLFYDFHGFIHNPLVLVMPPFHGFSSHGGTFGILVGVYIWCYRHAASYIHVLDMLCIVTCVVAALIRLGNLMNSEVVGRVTDLPWAFIFKRVDALPRHPVQLYESLFYFLMFFTLLILWFRTANRWSEGMMLGTFLVTLWSFRFMIEPLKDDLYEAPGGLLMGQWLSIPFIVLGIFLLLRKRLARVK
jgi:phosphatidylglycerol:prolipoprotein diacylglycerol transferase